MRCMADVGVGVQIARQAGTVEHVGKGAPDGVVFRVEAASEMGAALYGRRHERRLEASGQLGVQAVASFIPACCWPVFGAIP